MKRVLALIALMTMSGFAFAQAPASGQTGAANGQKPATAQATPAQPGAAAGKHQPVAKTQEEFKAYQEAAAKPDGPSAEAAADAFAQQYPQSELRAVLYQRVMALYQNANNSDKVIEIGRKTLSIEPDNGPALVTVATFLANRTRATDLDRDERLTEAQKDAQKALDLANAGQLVPAGTPDAQAAIYKDTLVSMAYAALGAVDFNNKNYPGAEQNLRKSVEPSKAQADPISYYQLALAQQRQGKNADALQSSTQCVQVAADNPQVANVCKNLQAYLQKLANNPPAKPAGAATPATTSPATTTPATTSPTTTPQPH